MSPIEKEPRVDARGSDDPAVYDLLIEFERLKTVKNSLLNSRLWQVRNTFHRVLSRRRIFEGNNESRPLCNEARSIQNNIDAIRREIDSINDDFVYKNGRSVQRILRRQKKGGVLAYVWSIEAKINPRAAVRKVRYIEDRLWGGYSGEAEARLLVLCSGEDSKLASESARLLSRWYAARGHYGAALGFLELADAKSSWGWRQQENQIIRKVLLALTGSQAVLEAATVERPPKTIFGDKPFLQASGLIASASISAALSNGEDEHLLEAERKYNQLYADEGFATIRRFDESGGFLLDNLDCVESQVGRDDDQMSCVSVICPTFNAETSIATVIRGLQGQSWRNLDIIIIDDASSDRTVEIARDFAANDQRIRVLTNVENRGGYANRNKALEVARGDYVTIHDADDWSHSQKIEVQVRHHERTQAPLSFTAWTRVAPDMRVIGLSRGGPRLVALNHSSGMMPIGKVRAAGGWDTTRISADTELFWRLLTLEGYQSMDLAPFQLFPTVPLSFGRIDPKSLTRTPVTHILTVKHGVRREYLEACAHWHRSLQPGDYGRAHREINSRTAFPVAGFIQSKRLSSEDEKFDLLLVCDWNLAGGVYHSARNMLHAASRAGYRVGLFHYCSFNRNVSKPLKDEVRTEAKRSGAKIVAPGETINVDLVVICYPKIFEFALDLFPTLTFRRLIVLQTQLPERNTTGTDVAYSLDSVRRTLRQIFNTEGDWKAISGRVQAIMRDQSRFPEPDEDLWMELVDELEWCTEDVAIINDAGRRPVVGRHGRDHVLKWPADPRTIADAYCADKPCDVLLMGGADIAIDKMGGKPKNWEVLPFGIKPSLEFLRDLDFFVHYPDEDYIEEFGRAPMEAMAVGIPVILPPSFEVTFGNAAIYSEPKDVWNVIERYWSDAEAMREQAQKGRDFVLKNCTYVKFAERLKACLADA